MIAFLRQLSGNDLDIGHLGPSFGSVSDANFTEE